MQRFENILVLIDTTTSDYPLQLTKAVELARANDSPLTLLDVIKNPQASMRRYSDFLSIGELTDMVKKTRLQQLDSLASSLRENGLIVNTMVKVGSRFIEAIKQVLLNQHDIVLSRPSLQQAKLSGDDLNLMRKCPCPVWMIRNLGETDKVLATLDINMEQTKQGQRLNRTIVQLAISLALRHESSACVVSCWSLFGEDALRNSSFVHVSEQKLQQMLDEEESAYREKLHNLLAEFDFPSTDAVLLKGDPKQLIPRFIDEQKVTTVVMGTLGRTGVPGLFIGNTAETVLTSIETSVLAVKPEGFESPVR